MINKEDVLQVAESLHIELNNEQIEYVLENYQYEVEADPTGEWYLRIENLIYQIID